MKYKLFDDFITLQSLLKTTGILPSGGAVKAFLTENTVLFNGEKEERRGKKIRLGDCVELPAQGIVIEIVTPSKEEKIQHEKDVAEKERITQMVKRMNKELKKESKSPVKKQKDRSSKKAPVRFPGI